MKLKRSNGFYLLCFEEEERFPHNVLSVLKKPGVIRSALGMAGRIKIGYFDKDRGYQKEFLQGEWEILSLTGFFHTQTEPPFHIHSIFGNNQMKVQGGHLFEFYVVNTMELLVEEIPFNIKRISTSTGLKVLDI